MTGTIRSRLPGAFGANSRAHTPGVPTMPPPFNLLSLRNEITAETFCDCMAQVWQDTFTPTQDGIVIKPSEFYNEWHNANVAARALGAIRTVPSSMGGKPARVWEFPSHARVTIMQDGSGCQPSERRHHSNTGAGW